MRFYHYLFVLLLTVGASPIYAWQDEPVPERPKSAELLPESTVLYIQIDNIVELAERLQDTSLGQLIQDEKISPLIQRLYDEAKISYEEVRDNVGVSLDEIRSLPTGELSFAVVGFEDRDPAVAFFIDYEQESETAQTLVDRGRQAAEEDGASFDTVDEGAFQIQTMNSGDGDDFIYIMRNGTFVGSSDLELMRDILARWDGDQVENIRSLAENRKFVTIMNRCRGTKDSPPEMRAFIDPIDLAKSATRGNFGARFMINALPILGLDGLLGIGGSIILDEDGYESITHGHILMASPRKGVLEMLALAPGDPTPEPIVPADVTTFMSSNWNVDKMFVEFEKIYNQFTSEDQLATDMDNGINEFLEMDFREEVLGALTGRATMVTWIEPPARFNSNTNATILELEDPEAFQETLDKVIEKIRREPENAEQVEYRGSSYWLGPDGMFDGRRRDRDDDEEEEEENPIDIRSARPCVGIVDKYLIIAGSEKLFERMVDTHKGDNPLLSDHQELVDVSRHMKRLLGTSVPAVTIYSKPGDTFRMMLEAAGSENTRSALDYEAEESELASRMKKVLDDNPIPDFSELEKYFAPSGAFITNDDTGLHMLSFQLKPSDDR